jgi:hypothetical protein
VILWLNASVLVGSDIELREMEIPECGEPSPSFFEKGVSPRLVLKKAKQMISCQSEALMPQRWTVWMIYVSQVMERTAQTASRNSRVKPMRIILEKGSETYIS